MYRSGVVLEDPTESQLPRLTVNLDDDFDVEVAELKSRLADLGVSGSQQDDTIDGSVGLRQGAISGYYDACIR